MLGPCSINIDTTRYTDYLNSDMVDDPGNISTFEETFSNYLGTCRSIATHQGRSALYIALQSLGLAADDEVLIQGFTWNGLIDIIIESGGKPVLVDCSMEDCNAHNQDFERKITEKTTVIIASHLFGIPCDIEEIADTAAEHDCYLIEDCAHAIGATYRGRKVGTFGDLSFFSFNIDKPLMLGQGGLLAINNPSLVDDVTRTLTGFEKMPLRKEKSILYGLLVEYVARRREFYSTPLYEGFEEGFGERLCRADQKLFSMIDSLVRENASNEEIVNSITPRVEKEIERLEASRSGNLRSSVVTAVSRGTRVAKKGLRIDSKRRIHSKNLLMNSMRAGIGTIEFQGAIDEAGVRNGKAEILFRLLKDNESFQSPIVTEEKSPSFFRFNVFNNSNESFEAIKKYASRQGFEISNLFWSKPAYAGSCHLSLEYDARELKVCEEIANRIINLPLHTEVNSDDLVRISAFLNDLDVPRTDLGQSAARPSKPATSYRTGVPSGRD